MNIEELTKNPYDFVKNLYEKNVQGGVTFSDEIGEEIQNELKRLIEEKKKWLEEHKTQKTN